MPRTPDKFTPDYEEAKKEAKEREEHWKESHRDYLQRLSDARTYLLMEHHFFGRLAMKMRLGVSEQIATAGVRADGTCYFNPELIDDLNIAELGAVLGHELMHLAFGHFDRQSGKDPQMWNHAGDYVINAMLKRAGLSLPERPNLTPLYDERFEELSDEQVYHVLEEQAREQQQQQQGQQGQGQQGQQQQQGGQSGQGDEQQQGQQQGQGGGGDGQQGQQEQQSQGEGGQGQDQQDQQQGGGGGGEGQKKDQQGKYDPSGQGQGGGERRGFGTGKGDCDFGATRGLKEKAEQGEGRRVLDPDQWRDEIVAAAQAAKSRGQLPNGIERWVDELRDPVMPWHRILRRLVSRVLKQGSTYQRPARRSAALWKQKGMPPGIRPILPGPKPSRKHVAVAVDTSGSMGEDELQNALSEIKDILNMYNRPIRVMAVDAEVHVDEDVRRVDEIELRGGGGTSTEPVFDRIEEEPGRWGEPAMLIYFSDLMASYPDSPPPYPVMWVNTHHQRAKEPPFGDVVDLDPDVASERHRLETADGGYHRRQQQEREKLQEQARRAREKQQSGWKR